MTDSRVHPRTPTPDPQALPASLNGKHVPLTAADETRDAGPDARTLLVSVRELHVTFPHRRGDVHAVRGINLDIHQGECVAIVGESGSGKSVTARTLVGLAGSNAQVRSSRFEIDGRPGPFDWRTLRGGFAGLVLQDALVSLDPLRTIGAEIAEVLRVHRIGGREQRVRALLESVHVPDPDRRARQHPHQLSGGLRQRALIASALAAGPPLLIADEPTTALDVTVQSQILDLLAERHAAGETLLLISHDLAVVSRLADRVLVMRNGHIVESGPTATLLSAPTHSYTQQLLAAVPSAASRGRRLSHQPTASSTTAPNQPAPSTTPNPVPPQSSTTPNSTPRSSTAQTRAPQSSTGVRAGQAPSTSDSDQLPSGVVIEATGLRKGYGAHIVVDDVNLTVRRGEIVGLVGESGSGKTTVAQLLFGLTPPTSGSVAFEGAPWTGLTERRRRPRRRRLQLISQDPLSAFDPRWTVGRIIAEALPASIVDQDTRRRRGRSDAVQTLLERVGLGADLLDRYPRQLSGGQRQRVAIARALAPRPSLIICDEPVSALDVSVQAQVLDLLADIRDTDGTALLFISHDLGVIHHLADRVLVMRDGVVVEQGPVDDVFHNPQHEYTRALIDAVPALEVSR
ncbi:nickel ABC transporter ATP-binding protein NikE [Paractinoplanes lichenicola]|uniref:Nickel ABC transporter ATP-binding protein NikE n=1 Tax=Paractinoplanes lichenicola TaxID=2802976 RepID=A0ABS1VZU6_9ACTN|nr:ABC transporter ATP-binding protein [Actinoplanes lichenicola]MBL7259975.1 nickel ABC transporter ATP-binding protein NikE [Actinoplanes lichenicola]